jgi:hypothetical protein
MLPGTHCPAVLLLYGYTRTVTPLHRPDDTPHLCTQPSEQRGERQLKILGYWGNITILIGIGIHKFRMLAI